MNWGSIWRGVQTVSNAVGLVFGEISIIIAVACKHRDEAYILSRYIEKSHLDIYQVNQLRLVISDYKNNSLGLIDLFDVDFKNFKAGIGILINKDNRDKGHAKEALEILIKYCFAGFCT